MSDGTWIRAQRNPLSLSFFIRFLIFTPAVAHVRLPAVVLTAEGSADLRSPSENRKFPRGESRDSGNEKATSPLSPEVSCCAARRTAATSGPLA